MRCDKTKVSFEAFVSFACTMILVKSVHRAYIRNQEEEDQRLDQMNLWR